MPCEKISLCNPCNWFILANQAKLIAKEVRQCCKSFFQFRIVWMIFIDCVKYHSVDYCMDIGFEYTIICPILTWCYSCLSKTLSNRCAGSKRNAPPNSKGYKVGELLSDEDRFRSNNRINRLWSPDCFKPFINGCHWLMLLKCYFFKETLKNDSSRKIWASISDTFDRLISNSPMRILKRREPSHFWPYLI